MLKKVPSSSCCSRFHPSSSLLFTIWVSLQSSVLCLCCGCKKLRVTSPLLIVLIYIEGSHWILATLPFIRGLLPHPSQLEWENVGITYKLLGDLGIPIHASPLSLSLSPSNLLKEERILSSSRLSWVRHDLGSF